MRYLVEGTLPSPLRPSWIYADPRIQQRLTLDADLIADRVTLDADLIADYASSIRDWIDQAPLTVFFDAITYWLADGFHRHAACEVAGLDYIPVIIHEGTRLDALRFALLREASI
ncbi:ParB/RepB/Spo0J family partition protein [Thiocystis violacea]|uniref:ParB/RepB/Spo0J family partition protein n=1 Tax=Thiocystis violacea TaxID=13725 RepID=UPI0019081E9D|nr:ParB/RepB/Spo0J family partition protein [Thiocystis violacea]MBK1718531.1 hypothetical protein [Thiocystis violacea]